MMLRSILTFMTIFMFLGFSACSGGDPSLTDGSEVSGGQGAINLEQGWSDHAQQGSWFTSFGSRIIPYQWMLHLEQAENDKLFREDAHWRKLGFLSADATALNPDGLPVGVTKAVDKDGKAWAGLGCAACHTGQIRYKGQSIRLDGGASMLDFQAFESAIIEALTSNLQNADKFSRFAQNLGKSTAEYQTLKVALTERIQYLRNIQQTNATDLRYGPGRLDAFGQIFNAVGVQFLANPKNRRVPDAPVSFPILWSAPHLDLVQWNGSAPNSGPGPLFQNATTSLAVYGTLDLSGHNGKAGYPSSVEFGNLGKIQEWVYQLKSPLWPEQILGPIDLDKAQKGKEIYQTECLSCHQLSDRNNPKRKIKVGLTKLQDIGTDPKMVNNFLAAKADAGELSGRKTAIFAGPVLETIEQTINLVVHSATGATLRHPVEAIRSAATGYHKVYKAQLDTHPDYYKARSLDGIWASSPFLHNGSVLSLAELLKPAEQRLKTFHVGTREFDPINVGLKSIADESDFIFDTSLPGNWNTGHDYGTGLELKEKAYLLEYLKTL